MAASCSLCRIDPQQFASHRKRQIVNRSDCSLNHIETVSYHHKSRALVQQLDLIDKIIALLGTDYEKVKATIGQYQTETELTRKAFWEISFEVLCLGSLEHTNQAA